MSTSDRRSYPLHVATEAGNIEFRMMGPADEAAVLAFAQALPAHDLLFLPRNISEPKVLAAWIKEIERGSITTRAVAHLSAPASLRTGFPAAGRPRTPKGSTQCVPGQGRGLLVRHSWSQPRRHEHREQRVRPAEVDA